MIAGIIEESKVAESVVSFGEYIRKACFNILVKANYRGINAYLRELAHQYKENISDKTDYKFAALMKHASTTTDFYAPFAGVDKLEDLPVVSKEKLKHNYREFFSNAFKIEDLATMKTSGSYGAPMQYHLDRAKKQRQLMELVYYNSWANYKVGMRHVLNITGSKKSRVLKYIQNESIHCFPELQGAWREALRAELKQGKAKIYIGFASALEEFAGYCEKLGDTATDFNLKGIITISQGLNEAARVKAEQVFGCPVISRYAAMEFGVLAHECPEAKKHHLNCANYIIELLAPDADVPVKPGEVGRIVVTDLHNFGVPLLRYDTGDLAVLSALECICGRRGPVFERIEGRLVENIFDDQGRRWSGFMISYLLRDYTELVRFQFVQKDKNKYLLKLITRDNFTVEAEIAGKIKEKLGQGIDLTIEYVEDIPPLQSGKRPYVINEYLISQQVKG